MKYSGEINCFRCGMPIYGYPALSRKNNKSHVCSKCGMLESLELFFKFNNSNKDRN